MTLATIFAPVAAATILNIFLFALFWRASRIEQRRGSTPWYFWAVLFAYALPVAYIVYRLQSKPITEKWELLGAIIGAEMLAGIVVFILLEAFVSYREAPWRQRGPITGAALFFLAVVLVGIYQAPI